MPANIQTKVRLVNGYKVLIKPDVFIFIDDFSTYSDYIYNSLFGPEIFVIILQTNNLPVGGNKNLEYIEY